MQNAPNAPVQSVAANVQSTALSLNNHFIGNLGLGVGAASIAGVATSVKVIFDHLSDGAFLQSLAAEHSTHVFGPSTSTLDGSLIGFFGSLVGFGFGLLGAYFGRPKTIASG